MTNLMHVEPGWNFLFNLRNGFLFFWGRVEGEGEERKERLVDSQTLLTNVLAITEFFEHHSG